MGFVDLERPRRGRKDFGRTRPTGPTLGVNKHGVAVLRFGDLRETLEWKTGDRFSLQVGSDEDAGWLRIAPAPDGKWQLREATKTDRNPSITVNAASLGAASEKRAAEDLRHRRAENALLVALPWFETGEERQEREFTEACALLRANGAIITGGSERGIYQVDGARHTALTIIERAAKMQKRAKAA